MKATALQVAVTPVRAIGVVLVAWCGCDCPADGPSSSSVSSSEASASGSQSTGVTSGAESSTAAEPSTGEEPPTLLCTDGPPPTWCFERRELDILGLPLDLDKDGLDD